VNEPSGQTWARKRLKLNNTNLEKLKEEVDHIRKAKHHHVVRVRESYKDRENRAFSIIMSPVADCDLHYYLKKLKSRGSEEEHGVTRQKLFQWIFCLATTLCDLHKRRIRHRDIKPGNLLVHGKNIYYTDFGTAFICQGSTRLGKTTTGATPRYMPPEGVDWTRTGMRGDIFCLGAVFLEILQAADSCTVAPCTESYGDYPNIPTFPKVPSNKSYAEFCKKKDFIKSIKATRENESVEFVGLLEGIMLIVAKMLSQDPAKRPEASNVRDDLEELYLSVGFPFSCEGCGGEEEESEDEDEESSEEDEEEEDPDEYHVA
jgi:serine/threonine protein kinase